ERQLRLANVRRADVGARAPLRTVEVIATGERAAGALVNEVAALGMAADGAKKRESTGTDQMLGGFAAIARNGWAEALLNRHAMAEIAIPAELGAGRIPDGGRILERAADE